MKCNRFSVVLAIAVVAVAALVLSTTSALANVITNPGFETTVPHANWNTFWGDTYTLGDWQATLYGDRLAYKTSGGNTGAYLGNNSGNPADGSDEPTAFYQAVDATDVSGDYEFSFDYLNTDSDGTDNVISWGIWGYPSPVDHDNFVNGNSIAFVHSQHADSLIASGDFLPGTVGWTNHAAPTFTVPSGLDRIIVGLGSDEFRPANGDAIGFDNVSLQEATTGGGPGRSIQFDVSDNSGSYQGTEGPAQANGLLTGADDNWNTVTGDVSSGLVFTDGSPASGVSIDFGRQEFDSGAVNWDVTGSETGRSGGSDIYANELMRDWMYTTSDDNLGVRVTGLQPGDYDVFALAREYDATGRLYSVAIGTDDDDSTTFDVDAGLIYPGLFRHDGVTGAPSTWAESANYFYQRVHVDDPSHYIVTIVDPTGAQYATLQGLQIVQVAQAVPEPSTFALAALGLLGLGWYGRRRRRRAA